MKQLPRLDQDFLTLPEAASLARCSVRTLQRLESIGEGPPRIQLSERRVLFARDQLDAWLRGRS